MGQRVLVVDDNKLNREAIRTVLQLDGYEVEDVGSGQEALENIRANPPDALLLDIMMPDMDGFQVLQQLQDEVAVRRFPIIMLTGLSDTEQIERATKLGACAYVVKPFEPDELLGTVKFCLDTVGM